MISIIIPIFNAEKTLYTTLECLMKQTYKNFEVILVDDGSWDRSKEICNQYTVKDARFKYFYQINQGVSAARNYGISLALGEFLTFVDSDDTVDDNYLEVLISMSHDFDLVICDIDIEKGDYKKCFTMSDVSLNAQQALNELLQRRNINSGPYGKLYRRDIVDQIVFPDLKTYEDILFNMKVFKCARKIFVTNKTQYHYIQNSDGAMSRMFECPSEDIIIATGKIMEFLKENKELDDRCSYITLSHLLQYVYRIVDQNIGNSKRFLILVKKLYRKYWKEIILNQVFSGKEKIVFTMCSIGILIYRNHLTLI